jgi:Macrocin-O-methyltransferase (TylF)
MSDLTRSINRALGQTLGVQVVAARTRRVALDEAWFARMIHFNSLVEQIADVSGDFVECGVADGVSLATLTSLLKAHRQTRHTWGFDSWAGLPAPSSADLGDASVAVGGMFSHSSTEKVRDELLAYGLTGEEVARDVTLVPGLFSETLPHHRGSIALLHVDVDLYQSYLDCLTNLWTQVEVGGVVAFDEYGESDTWPGARRAVDEFFAENSADVAEWHHDEISDKWYVVKGSKGAS